MKNKKIFLFFLFLFILSLISISLYRFENDISKTLKGQILLNQNNHQSNKYYNHEKLKTVNNKENKVKTPTHKNYFKKQKQPGKIKSDPSFQIVDSGTSNDSTQTTIDYRNNTKSVELSMNTIDCLNGGIGFSGKCICPMAFYGDNCELLDSNEQCTNPTMEIEYMYNKTVVSSDTCLFSPSSLCCWSKYRTDLNISNRIFTITLKNDDSEIIKTILTTYGPWSKNDKLMMKYLFKSTDNNQYSLKYKKQNVVYHQVNSRYKSKLAFVLMIHQISLEDISILFLQIYSFKHYYIIHIDNNFNDEILIGKLIHFVNSLYNKKIKENIFLKPGYPINIQVLKDRFTCAWGSIALVYSELAAYTRLFDMVEQRQSFTGNGEKDRWSHIINLSINDFPIRPLSELELFLSINSNKNFIDEEVTKDESRFNKPWVECSNKNIKNLVGFNFNVGTLGNNQCGITGIEMTIDRSKNFKEGSQWHFLTYEFANYLISDFNAITRLFSVKFSFVPDESYFQLSKSESHFHDKPSDHNQRFIPWSYDYLNVNMTLVENNFDGQNRNFFTRKVYSTNVKKAIIKKYLKKVN